MPRLLSASSGSTPLETVVWAVVLLAPLPMLLALYGQLSDQLAADSIARHALRAAVLQSSTHTQLQGEVTRQLPALSLSWGKKVTSSKISCTPTCTKGNIVTLEVKVGNSLGVQSAALAPK